MLYAKKIHAGVVKLVDTLDLGSSASRLGGSSPSTRTFLKQTSTPKTKHLNFKATLLLLRACLNFYQLAASGKFYPELR